MNKKSLISKLNIKDYNKELEKILVNKDFSGDIKNLLLSMLYKIENSYEDYKKIKVEVKDKKDILQDLLKIISTDCKEIQIIKPTLGKDKKLKGKQSIIEKNKIISYPNEKVILEALYKLNSNKYTIIYNYKIVAKALEKMLNTGEILNNSEIIKDFDGWAWNIEVQDIEDYTYNLLYKSIIYLLGYENITSKKEFKLSELKDIFILNNIDEKIFILLLQISILKYINDKDKSVLLEEKQKLENEFEDINDKKKYIENITKRKKEIIKELNKIDIYMNDPLLLRKEYIKQNEVLPQKERVFSLSDFSEKVQKDKNNLLHELDELAKRTEPENYIKEKEKIEEKLEFILALELENEQNKVVKELVNKFTKLVCKTLCNKIKNIQNKKEVIDMIYEIRYYKMLPINSKQTVENIAKKEIQRLEKTIVTHACNLKFVTIYSKDVETNYKIIEAILNTKIIDLENVYVEIKKDFQINIYDENSLESSNKYKELKDINVKLNKKIKFII